jgi:hypothetical protein
VSAPEPASSVDSSEPGCGISHSGSDAEDSDSQFVMEVEDSVRDNQLEHSRQHVNLKLKVPGVSSSTKSDAWADTNSGKACVKRVASAENLQTKYGLRPVIVRLQRLEDAEVLLSASLFQQLLASEQKQDQSQSSGSVRSRRHERSKGNTGTELVSVVSQSDEDADEMPELDETSNAMSNLAENAAESSVLNNEEQQECSKGNADAEMASLSEEGAPVLPELEGNKRVRPRPIEKSTADLIIEKDMFFCKKCNVRFKTYAGLGSHVSRVHKDMKYSEQSNKGRFVCRECNKAFPNLSKLRRHSPVHKGNFKLFSIIKFVCFLKSHNDVQPLNCI